VTVSRVEGLRRHVLQARPESLPSLSAAFGSDINTVILQSSSVGSARALRLGPDEWLIVTAPGDTADNTFRLGDASRRAGASLVEVTDRQHTYRIQGPARHRLLESGCPVDLETKALREGATFRTLLGRIEVVLWADADAWNLEVWRSFAPYVEAFLAEAALSLVD